jgi:hypothetical protein
MGEVRRVKSGSGGPDVQAGSGTIAGGTGAPEQAPKVIRK